MSEKDKENVSLFSLFKIEIQIGIIFFFQISFFQPKS